MIWEVCPEDYIRDGRLLFVKRQKSPATPTEKKVLFLNHHIAPVEVAARNGTFDARTFTVKVPNCLSVRE